MLSIEKGEFICLLGPSGCGKSTLLNAIAGFSPVTSGSVKIEGKEVKSPSVKDAITRMKFPAENYRRVILARNLLLHTDILLADEPTSNLDACSAEIVRDVLNEMPMKIIFLSSLHTILFWLHRQEKIFVWVIESVYGLQ